MFSFLQCNKQAPAVAPQGSFFLLSFRAQGGGVLRSVSVPSFASLSRCTHKKQKAKRNIIHKNPCAGRDSNRRFKIFIGKVYRYIFVIIWIKMV